MKQIYKQLKSDNAGISPVVGVILMVAITVVLASIIGVFVLGIGMQDSSTSNTPAVDVSNNGNGEYIVKIVQMNNADTVKVETSTGDSEEISSVGGTIYIELETGESFTVLSISDGSTTVISTEDQDGAGAGTTSVSTSPPSEGPPSLNVVDSTAKTSWGGNSMESVAVGDTLFVLGDGYLKALDVSSPSSPTVLDTYSFSATAGGIATDGSHVYASFEDNTVRIFDASTPGSISSGPINTISTSTDAYYTPVLEVENGYLYTHDTIYDVSDPQNPSTTADISSYTHYDSTAYNTLKVNGDYLYLADANNNNIRIVDVSTPSSPSQIVSGYTAGGQIETGWDMTFKNNKLYLGTYYSGSASLQVVDVSTPSSPSLSTTINDGSWSHGPVVRNNYAFQPVGGTDISVYDLSSGSSSPVDSVTTGNAKDVTRVGDYLYVTGSGSDALVVIEIQ
jgi:flagellin-like protein